MKIVLDTNVYIAAFLKKSLASKILNYAQSRNINLFVSNSILNELRGTLRDKFKVDKIDIDEFERLIRISATLIEPKERLQVIKEDPDDNKIIESAIAANADLIVTMDRHLLKLKEYEGIGIVHAKTLTWILPKILDQE